MGVFNSNLRYCVTVTGFKSVVQVSRQLNFDHLLENQETRHLHSSAKRGSVSLRESLISSLALNWTSTKPVNERLKWDESWDGSLVRSLLW